MKDVYRFVESPMPLNIDKAKLRCLENIARVGSYAYQQKFCVQGTAQEYMLLDELIETTLSQIEHEITDELLSAKWSQIERDALRIFVDRTNQLFEQIAWRDETLTISSIVNEHPSMHMIRDNANKCLQQVRAHFSDNELLAD